MKYIPWDSGPGIASIQGSRQLQLALTTDVPDQAERLISRRFPVVTCMESTVKCHTQTPYGYGINNTFMLNIFPIVSTWGIGLYSWKHVPGTGSWCYHKV